MSKFCFDWQWPGIVPGPGLASRNYMNLFHILIWCPAYHCTVLYCAVLYCTVLYLGMQGKIERFIHDMALRNTMLRAHRQAWVWQDEWFGLTIEDIREIERKTAEELKRKMRGEEDDGDEVSFQEILDESHK